MKRIFLSALDARTPFLFEIFKNLPGDNLGVWFVTNPYWKKWLLDHNVAAEHIIDQSFPSLKDCRRNFKIDNESREVLNLVEKEAGFPIHSIAGIDRYLRELDHGQIEYLSFIVLSTKEALEKFGCDLFIAEGTPAHELIYGLLCRVYNIKFAAPSCARIPSDRFLLFKDFMNYDYHRVPSQYRQEQDWTEQDAKDFLAKYRRSLEKPKYFVRNNKYPLVRKRWVNTFFHRLSEEFGEGKHNMNRPSFRRLVKDGVRVRLNRMALRKFQFDSVEGLGDYFVYALHMQPELIDIIAPFYSNQYEIIRAIAMSLPIGMKLVVKEHSNALGNRPIKYFNSLRKFPNIVICDPKTDGTSLLLRSRGVITVGGTMAFEASMYGVPSIVFSQLFFRNIASIFYCKGFQELPGLLKKCLEFKRTEETEQTVLDCIMEIRNNSFKGEFTDVVSDPSVLDPMNVKTVATSIQAILEL